VGEHVHVIAFVLLVVHVSTIMLGVDKLFILFEREIKHGFLPFRISCLPYCLLVLMCLCGCF
jgi:hypothetical protein